MAIQSRRVTAAAFPFTFGAACGGYSVEVPAGVLLKPIDGEPGVYWVDEFAWCNGIERHDAEHYGIRVPESATKERGKVPTAARFEPSTRTIRSVPENYWLASMDSWDGAVAHDASARILARAFAVERAATALIEAFGGDTPDWLASQVTALAEALTKDN